MDELTRLDTHLVTLETANYEIFRHCGPLIHNSVQSVEESRAASGRTGREGWKLGRGRFSEIASICPGSEPP